MMVGGARMTHRVSGLAGITRLLAYASVYLPLKKVADTHFHIQ